MRKPDPSYRIVILLCLLGLGLAFANRKLPLVRNSLVYARAAEHLIEFGFDPRPVVADSKLSYDKPILYPWISAPFVAFLGTHGGLRVTSFLGTLAYILAVRFFARVFQRQIPVASGTTLVCLSALGPCVYYQFWSAHPDSWFASLVIVAWAMTHDVAERPDVTPAWRLLLLGAAIYLAVLLKYYGLVLLISCPLYLTIRLSDIRAALTRERFLRLVAIGGVTFGTVAVLIILARTGHNSLARLEGSGGGVEMYGRGPLGMAALGTVGQLFLAALLQFNVTLPLALWPQSWDRALLTPMVCFGGIYILGLMPFPVTFFNMRYFLPILPLIALGVVRGLSILNTKSRRRAYVLYISVAIGLIAIFNVAPFYRIAQPAIPRLLAEWDGDPFDLLDNLRMPEHLEQDAIIRHINKMLPQGGTLYMLDVSYYGDAQHGVYERAGLIRSDIKTVYTSYERFAPPDGCVYVYLYPSTALHSSPAREWGLATPLGNSLYRVVRN